MTSLATFRVLGEEDQARKIMWKKYYYLLHF